MNFCEAVEKLKAGSKITRELWEADGVYLLMNDKGDIKSYKPYISQFNYDESIIVSDGWIVEGEDEQKKFCELPPYFLQKKSAWLNAWKEEYIYYDFSSKFLVQRSMTHFYFRLEFDSFSAEDWIEVF